MKRAILCGIAVLCVLAPTGLRADTMVSGTIATNTTWTLAGSPYVVTGSLYVSGSGAPVLTIEPGVVVRVDPGYEIAVGWPSAGSLQANGTASAPILFTANGTAAAGSWKSLGFFSSGSAMSYVTVEYAGWPAIGRGGVHVGLAGTATLDHVTIRNGDFAGMTVSETGIATIANGTISGNTGPGLQSTGTGALSISSTALTNNSGYAISVPARLQLDGLTGMSASGNGHDVIERRGGNIDVNTTWRNCVLPYAVTGASITVSGATAPVLTIEPGVVVRIDPGYEIAVGWPSAGSLQANGTAAAPILFTANGTATAGSWKSLGFFSSGNAMSYVTVEYAGWPAIGRGSVHAGLAGATTLDHVTIRNGEYAGMTVSETATATIANGTISGNTGAGLQSTGTGTLSISSTSLTNNSGYAITVPAKLQLDGLTGMSVSGNGHDVIERRGGTIDVNTTWRSCALPYVVTGASLFVSATSAPVLTIEPGVVVRIDPGYEIAVGWPSAGSLQANGTASAPILFTANGTAAAGSWRSLGLFASGNTMSYVTVEYGGWPAIGRGGVHLGYAGAAALDHVTILNGAYAGMTVSETATATIANGTISGNTGPGLQSIGTGTLSISSTSLTNNSGYAISVPARLQLDGLSGMSASGNGHDVIERRGGTIDVNTTWRNCVLPYVVTGASIIVSGAAAPVLTIEPGVVVRVDAGYQIAVGSPSAGSLQANGTATAPILFTANGVAAPGSWSGISILASGSALSYVTVEYAGWAANARGGVHVGAAGAATIDHVAFRNNAHAGFTAGDAVTATVTNGLFAGNAAGIINHSSNPIDARLCYWGTADGPAGSGYGTGQSVGTAVRFDPWLTAVPSSPNFYSSASTVDATLNPQLNIPGHILFTTTFSGNWVITVADALGTTVRTFSGAGASADVSWDGKDDLGVVQPDGTYTFQLASSSTTGGTATTARGRLTIDTGRLLTVSASASPDFFSPNGDGVRDTATVTVSSNYENVQWTVMVNGAGGTAVRTLNGSGRTVSLVWDGKNTAGATAPEGAYTFAVTATAGSASATATVSPGTTLDVTPPLAAITSPTASQTISNVYSGSTDREVMGSVSDANLSNWWIQVVPAGGGSGYTLASGTGPVTAGQLALWATLGLDAGTYSVQLHAFDRASNQSVSTISVTVANFTVYQSAYDLSLVAGGSVHYVSVVPFPLTERLYIKNEDGTIVRTLVNVARAAGTYDDVWDGTGDAGQPLPDGTYSYYADVADSVTSSTMTWDASGRYRTLPPPVWRFYYPSITPFDPLNNSPLGLTFSFPVPGRLLIVFTPYAEAVTCPPPTYCPCDPPNYCWKSYEWLSPGQHTFYWNGLDNNHVLRRDLNHVSVTLWVDLVPENMLFAYGTAATLGPVRADPALYGPGSGSQTISFDVTTHQNRPVTTKVTFTNVNSQSVLRTINVPLHASGHIAVPWDGKADNGMWVAAGWYAVNVTVTDTIGNRSSGSILTNIQY